MDYVRGASIDYVRGASIEYVRYASMEQRSIHASFCGKINIFMIY